jgi:hypothetical protein
MYRRPVLCTFHIAVEILIVPYKGRMDVGGGGGSEYVRLIYVLAEYRPQNTEYKSLDFKAPPLPMALVMDIARIKIITSRAI